MRKSPSGKFVLRAGAGLHGHLIEYAESRGVSLNAACVELLADSLGRKGAAAGLPLGLDRILSSACSFSSEIIGIVLYGSVARGSSTRASDVDVLVVVGQGIPITRSLYANLDEIFAGEPQLSVSVSHLPPRGQRVGSLWLEVAQDGVILFDPNGDVARRLSDIRRDIASGKIRRRESHGQGYWVYA